MREVGSLAEACGLSSASAHLHTCRPIYGMEWGMGARGCQPMLVVVCAFW